MSIYERMQTNKEKRQRSFEYMLVALVLVILCVILLLVTSIVRNQKKTTEKIVETNVQFHEHIEQSLLTHGPIIGAVTDSSADVWVRIKIPNTFKVQIITSPQAENLNQSTPSSVIVSSLLPIPYSTTPQSVWDYTWKGTVGHLSPNTKYYYTLDVNGQVLSAATYPNSVYPSFKTYVTPGQKAEFNVVFYSDFFWNQDAIYNTFQYINRMKHLTLPPAIVFLGGDLWHADASIDSSSAVEFINNQRSRFQRAYVTNMGVYSPFHNDIVSHYPLVHIMDDHDTGVNNADGTFRYKTQALQVLQEYFPTYPLPASGKGFWQKFSYGQVDFFLIDVRSQRSPYTQIDDEHKTMLGSEQLLWLKQSLLQSKATWKFIYTGVVFNSTLGKTDSWMGYTKERTELVRFLKGQSADNASPVTGVIFISGDAHGGAIDDGTNADFPEMLVPGPETRYCWTTAEVGKWSNGYYSSPYIAGGEYSNPPCPGFGIANFFTQPDRVELTVKDDKGMTKLFLRHFLNPNDE